MRPAPWAGPSPGGRLDFALFEGQIGVWFGVGRARRIHSDRRAQPMNAVGLIAVWGLIALAAAVAGGFVAAMRNRDHSWWAAWCFVLPPMLLLVLFLPTRSGPPPRRPTMDEEDPEVV